MRDYDAFLFAIVARVQQTRFLSVQYHTGLFKFNPCLMNLTLFPSILTKQLGNVMLQFPATN